MDLVTVTNISLVEQGTTIVATISFTKRRGQKLALAGASGAGKSTLLQLVAGLAQPATGEVRISGERVRRPHEALIPGHPGVAYLSQKSELPHSLHVSGGLPLVPQLVARSAVEVNLPGLARASQGLVVHVSQREYLAGMPILQHARDQAMLVEADRGGGRFPRHLKESTNECRVEPNGVDRGAIGAPRR